jgi:hypothetical protein
MHQHVQAYMCDRKMFGSRAIADQESHLLYVHTYMHAYRDSDEAVAGPSTSCVYLFHVKAEDVEDHGTIVGYLLFCELCPGQVLLPSFWQPRES